MNGQALAAAALLALAGCAANQPFRLGAGVGAAFATIDARSEGSASTDSLEFGTRGAGGFLEVMVPEGPVELVLRASAQQSRGDIAGVATDGEVAAQRVTLLVSTPANLLGAGALRPLFGISVGHLEVDFDALLPYERGHLLTGGFAFGLECELGGHVLLGAMSWFDYWGYPGDTDGNTFDSLVYVGARF